MAIKSVISGRNEITVSLDAKALSMRERLKLVGFRWNGKSKTWYLKKDSPCYELVVKAIYAQVRAPEAPVSYGPDTDFLLSRWHSGAVLLQETPRGIAEACESAVAQGSCLDICVVSDDPAKWKGFHVLSRRALETCEDVIRPGLVVIFDGVPTAKTKVFTLCALLSLAAAFRVVVLDPFSGIETLQSAVLLADPGFSPPYGFYKDHVASEKKGFRTVRRHKDIDGFISKISPIVRKNVNRRPPMAVPVEAKRIETVLYERAMMKFSGVKRTRLAELSLVDAVSAAREMHEEIPPDYRTAKQEKATELSRRFSSLSMTVSPRCDAFLYAKKLEDGKAENMFQSFELLSKFADFSFPM